MNDTYIKITPDDLIEICKAKLLKSKEHEDRIIQKHIEINVKPKRKVLFFFNRPAITKEDVLATLDEKMDSPFYTTLREYLCQETIVEQNRVNNLISMAETARNSPDPLIRLDKSDYYFLTH